MSADPRAVIERAMEFLTDTTETDEMRNRNAYGALRESVSPQMVPCSACDGEGATYEQVRVGQQASPFVCGRCDGDGEVPIEREAGDRLSAQFQREAREFAHHAARRLREAAAKLETAFAGEAFAQDGMEVVEVAGTGVWSAQSCIAHAMHRHALAVLHAERERNGGAA